MEPMTDSNSDPDPALGRIALVLVLVSLSVVGGALVLENAFGFAPCDLCLYQRVPWFLVLGFGATAMMRKVSRQTRLTLLVSCALALVAGAGLAFYHVGIEMHWWVDAGACRASRLPPIQSIEDLTAALAAGTPTVPRCDDSAYLIAGTMVTLAQVNLFVSLILSGTLISALVRFRRFVGRL